MKEADPVQTPLCPRCGMREVAWQDLTFCPACIHSVTQTDSLGRMGPYVLESHLGEGGMGHVYLAFHESTGRAVAVKTPRAEGRDRQSLLQRFLQEARALSALDHSGILPIYEVGEEKGEPWFAMKLAEGGTLADLLLKGRLPSERAAELLADIAAAVQYAHDRGVLHRDLKPHNILLDDQGRPMLGDFGMARWEGHEQHLSMTLAAMGTPDYAAPEMAQGRAPSAAADIFSLGAILYHLLAGVPPFRAENLAATLARAAEGRVEPLTRQGVSQDLWQICRKCLEPEPADRYLSASALEADLRAWSGGLPVSVRRLSPAEKLRRVVRRNPLMTLLFLTTALAVVVALAAVIMADHRVGRSNQERARSESHLADERRHAERLAHIELLLNSGRAGQRRLALGFLQEQWRHKPGPMLRSLAIRALVLGDFSSTGGPLPTGNVYSVNPFPRTAVAEAGGRRVRVTGATGTEIQVEDRDGKVEGTFTINGRATALRWNPAGDSLAVACFAKGVYLWRAGEPDRVTQVRPQDSAIGEFIWHPGGRYIACLGLEGALRLWDLERADYVVMEQLAIPLASPPQWSRAGDRLTWTDKAGTPHEIKVDFPKGVRFLRLSIPGERRENFQTVDLDSKRGLVAWTSEQGVYLWDVPSGRARLAVGKTSTEWMGARLTSAGIQTCGWDSGLRGLANEPLQRGEFLPSDPGKAPFVGTVLMAASANDWLALLERPANRFILTPAGNPRSRKFLAQAEPYSVSLNPEGTLAATSSFQHAGVRLWRLPDAALWKELPVEGPASFLALSPDSRSLATVGGRQVQLWDVEKGTVRVRLPVEARFKMAAWSPDGTLIALQSSTGTQIFRAADGVLLASLFNPSPKLGDQHLALAFDRKVPLLAEQLSDGSIILWDLAEISRELQALGMGW